MVKKKKEMFKSKMLMPTIDMLKCLNNVLACRWYQATKSNNQAMAAKADSLKDEMDEAVNKVEICKVL